MGEMAIRPVRMFSLVNGKEVGIPITRLGKNQSVHVRCHALKGFGKMHQHSGMKRLQFKNKSYAELIIDHVQAQSLSLFEKQSIRDSCPVNVFAMDANQELIVYAIEKCVFCEECIRSVTPCVQYIGQIHEETKIDKMQHKNKYIFTVESAGQLKAVDIVKQVLIVLRKKVDEISQDLSFAQQYQQV